MIEDLDFKPGDRIRLICMGEDPCPIPSGATGQVRGLTHWYGETRIQVAVRWDIHRSLMLVWPEDEFEVIARPRSRYFDEQLGLQ